MVTTTSSRFAGNITETEMTSPWGPAFDAEISYRHEQVRRDFRPRKWWQWRRPVLPAVADRQQVITHQIPAQVSTPQVPVQALTIPEQPTRQRESVSNLDQRARKSAA
jgi:hypothetical protein